MKLMKIKVNNSLLEGILEGRKTYGCSINDNVSTTRKDRLSGEHYYESRHSLLRAFYHASASRRLQIVSAEHPNPVKAELLEVGKVHVSGLVFDLYLAPVEEE